MKKEIIIEEECSYCHGTGWDEPYDDKCDDCGGSGVTETVIYEEIKDVKKYIKSVLGEDQWTGISVNGVPYTQWYSNKTFFKLWREYKDEIKRNNFSLYKDNEKGWIVTLFENEKRKVI